jgi:hypothetical protein
MIKAVKIAALVCVAAVAAYYLAVWFITRDVVPYVAVDTTQAEMRDALAASEARARALEERLVSEVRRIGQSAHSRVASLPLDDVAAGINRELALYRAAHSDDVLAR